MPTSELQALVDRIVGVLAHRPCGYFSDFDGVLSAIAPTPDEAYAHPGIQEALDAISERVDACGIITGRAVADVATKLDISDLSLVGNHGLEWMIKGEGYDHPAGIAAVEAIASVLDETREQFDVPGMIWENKRLSGTIHFRNVADPDATERSVLAIVEPLAAANNLRVTAGKMIVEIRPRAQVSKGTALVELMEKNNLNGVVFWGDDVTDVDGFKALRDARAQGKHTLSVGVVTPDSHPDIAEYSDLAVRSVDEVAETFAMVAEALGSRS